MPSKKSIFLLLGALLLSSSILMGCPGLITGPGVGPAEEEEKETTSTDGTGTLTVKITDFPLGDKMVESIFVTITKVEVSKVSAGDSGWIVVADNTDDATGNDTILPVAESDWPDCDASPDTTNVGCYDLIKLVDSVASIGQTQLEAGTYTQIRLILEQGNKIKFVDDPKLYPIKIPSGTETGIKINGNMEVVAGQETAVTLDFDAQQSVKQLGKFSTEYLLEPVIMIQKTEQEGEVSNTAPTLTVSADASELATGATTSLTASASDPDGDEIEYEWEADAGQLDVSADGKSAIYTAPDTVPEGGIVTITVKVSDGKAETTKRITIAILSDNGTLTVLITDFPLGDKTVEKVLITITKVEVSKASTDDSGWVVVADNTDDATDNDTISADEDCDGDGSADVGCYDLMKLVDSVASIGQTQLEAGTYTQIRLILEQGNKIKFVDDPKLYPIKIPSGTETGIKINGNMEVVAGQETAVTLDFDAQQSVKQLGKFSTEYLLEPVIHIQGTEQEGGKSNSAPSVTVQTDVSELATGATTSLTASASDPDGDEIEYEWEADAGQLDVSADGKSATYTAPSTVPEGGMDVVTVTVSDGELENEATVGITIR